MTIPLFEHYPLMAETLPYHSICDLPTPVEKLEQVGDSINIPSLFVKRDDISSSIFGGNKVRTLEFLLGDVIHEKSPKALVMGLPGTSMALATALFAKKNNLNLGVVLLPQYPTEEARRNLLIFCKIGAELHTTSFKAVPWTLAGFMLGGLFKYGRIPKMLSASSPRGMAGYVNAAFELKRQIEQGALPEPDLLYVAMGLLGTATGLILGLRAAGLKTKVVAVHVQPETEDEQANTKAKMVKLFQEANAFLRTHDATFPEISIQPADFDVRGDLPEQQTDTLVTEGVGWIERIQQLEGITLDASWTAQAWAALVRDGEALHDKTVLLWHTYNSRPSSVNIDGVDYHALPKDFHRYFEEAPQLLNRPMLGNH